MKNNFYFYLSLTFFALPPSTHKHTKHYHIWTEIVFPSPPIPTNTHTQSITIYGYTLHQKKYIMHFLFSPCVFLGAGRGVLFCTLCLQDLHRFLCLTPHWGTFCLCISEIHVCVALWGCVLLLVKFLIRELFINLVNVVYSLYDNDSTAFIHWFDDNVLIIR